jgi:putative hemolysin
MRNYSSPHRNIIVLNNKKLSSNFISWPRGIFERLSGLDKIETIYSRTNRSGDGQEFLRRVIAALNIRYEIFREDLSYIPPEGPVVVVANHPFGGIEGILLASLLGEVRKDLKIMANYLLQCFPELHDLMIFVDPFGKNHSIKKNIPALKEAIRWLQRGGMLTIFPAGEVAQLNLKAREISDPPWSETCARIIKKTGAAVLPVYFPGANGPLFQILGLLHPRLRTALLPRELINKQGRTIKLKIGKVIPFERLQSFESDADMTAYLRLRTYILKAAFDNDARVIPTPKAARGSRRAAVCQPQCPSHLIREINQLPREQVLLKSGEFSVCYAPAGQMPCLLREIGRLRELTFRRAHEGTGRPIDLDRFDAYYLHLFVWNEARHEVVGAYRIGQTDKILKYLGIDGLYTSTLFKYKRALLDQITPALELGRSFVRPEYQKSYSSLLLLWKGVSAFVVKKPQYKILFGPVSINNEYHTISQQLMAATLKFNNDLPGLGRLVKANNPFPIKPIKGCDMCSTKVIQDINELSDLIMDIETENKGIPILLKQYLKMGGKVLGFNRDPYFSNVLDGLILVDLTMTQVNLLERYMGKKGAETFLNYHHKNLSLFPACNGERRQVI